MTFSLVNTILEAKQAFNIITDLGEYYPDFHHWYWNKVVPGTILGVDQIILAINKNEVVGVSIIKDTTYEQKIRAIRVKDTFRNKGYGPYLMDESLRLLNNDKPLVSVSEDMMHSFSRMFVNRYDFDVTMVHKNLYKHNKLEYQFNGVKDSLLKTSSPY